MKRNQDHEHDKASPAARTASGVTVREKYMKELSTNPKWKDTTKAGDGFVVPGAKPGAAKAD